MMSEALILRSEDSQEDYTNPSKRVPSLLRAFDTAVQRYNLDSMHYIAESAENLVYLPDLMSSGKLQMMRIAVPAYEQVFQLHNNFPLDEDLLARLDGMNAQSLAFIEQTLEVRRQANVLRRTEEKREAEEALADTAASGDNPNASLVPEEMPKSEAWVRSVREENESTGVISEGIVQAMANKAGRHSAEILIPSSERDDKARRNRLGQWSGFDFTAYSPDEIDNPVKVQVKTTGYIPHGEVPRVYADDILVVKLGDLIETDGNLKARHRLPRAILMEGLNSATPQQRFMAEEASENLHKLIAERRSQQQ